MLGVTGAPAGKKKQQGELEEQKLTEARTGGCEGIVRLLRRLLWRILCRKGRGESDTQEEKKSQE